MPFVLCLPSNPLVLRCKALWTKIKFKHTFDQSIQHYTYNECRVVRNVALSLSAVIWASKWCCSVFKLRFSNASFFFSAKSVETSSVWVSKRDCIFSNYINCMFIYCNGFIFLNNKVYTHFDSILINNIFFATKSFLNAFILFTEKWDFTIVSLWKKKFEL